MLSVSIDQLAEHSETIATEIRAGHTLELLQGGKRIAEIVPAGDDRPAKLDARFPAGEKTSLNVPKWRSEEERLAAVADLMAFLEKGLDLGGFRIEDRSALYDRD